MRQELSKQMLVCVCVWLMSRRNKVYKPRRTARVLVIYCYWIFQTNCFGCYAWFSLIFVGLAKLNAQFCLCCHAKEMSWTCRYITAVCLRDCNCTCVLGLLTSFISFDFSYRFVGQPQSSFRFSVYHYCLQINGSDIPIC